MFVFHAASGLKLVIQIATFSLKDQDCARGRTRLVARFGDDEEVAASPLLRGERTWRGHHPSPK